MLERKKNILSKKCTCTSSNKFKVEQSKIAPEQPRMDVVQEFNSV